MRILVTGSRDWRWPSIVRIALLDTAGSEWKQMTVVHGDCPSGADQHARDCVELFGGRWKHDPHPADWSQHGKVAGPIRNAEMVSLGADICLAFILNKSRGATGCVELAMEAGIPVLRFSVDEC